MKKNLTPLYARWHVRLVILILALFVIYLTVKSFRTGYKEALEQKSRFGV